MERHFKRDLSALDEVFSFIDHYITTTHLNQAVAFPVNIAIEELFVNMIEYNPDGEDDIAIGFEQENNQLIITLRDSDSSLFDLTQHEVADVDAPLAEREPGGLGIHLVKTMMDEIYYEYKDRLTRIRLVKNLDA